jgi:hypothetical protein
MRRQGDDMKLAFALVAALAGAAAIAATCVTRMDQLGSGGPWTGTVQNVGPLPQQGAGVTAQVADADGNDLPLDGQPLAPVCPSMLLPGEEGAYELGVGTQPGARLPLSARIIPLDTDATAPAMWGEALHAEVTSIFDRAATVTIRNNGTQSYRGVVVCSVIARDGFVVETEYAQPLDRELAPGETTTARVHLPEGANLQHRLYPLGERDDACCAPPADWRATAIGDAFTIMLPPGWEYVPLQGIDSFVGEIRGDGMVLFFDYGSYTGKLVADDDPAYEVRYENIGGFPAQVVRALNDDDHVTGAHIYGIGPTSISPSGITLSISTDDLAPNTPQQALVLDMLQTIRFPYPGPTD